MEEFNTPEYQLEALNLDLLQEHILLLRSGESIEKPVYDMKVSNLGAQKK
jgi:uridine kinase